MSRSALWRQEDNLKERERRAAQIFASAIEEGRSNNHLRGVIPLHCPDDTFHIHPMLLHNISASPYFQKCCEKLTDWNMVVDEIYYEVKHMEPWTAGKFQHVCVVCDQILVIHSPLTLASFHTDGVCLPLCQVSDPSSTI